MNGRSKRQITSIRSAYQWHLDMAASLEFKGRFSEALEHLTRARLLEPALKQSDSDFKE